MGLKMNHPDDLVEFKAVIGQHLQEQQEHLNLLLITQWRLDPRDDLKILRYGDRVWTTNTQDIYGIDQQGHRMQMVQRQSLTWQQQPDGQWTLLNKQAFAPSMLKIST